MTPSAPSSPAAPAHDIVSTRAFIERVRELRARDQRRRTKAWRAFKILLVVGFLLCVLAAIVLPGFLHFGCRSRQSEGKGNLKALFVAQEAAFEERGAYDQRAAGFVPSGARIRYAYFNHVEESSFVALAVGIDDVPGDLWRISEKNDLEVLSNACLR